MAAISKIELVVAMLGRHVAHGGKRAGITIGADAAPLLEVEHLSAGRKVRDVSLSLRSGEIIGLAGLLGSGRTETARVVFGADKRDGGEIRLLGAPARFAEPIDAIRAGLGFCTEDRKIEGIVPEMSVRENLTLALLPRLTRAGIVDETKQRAIVEDFIRRLGVKTSSPEQKIRELSGGNQQKVLLARWLCMNPRLLIVDEPTRGIDVGAKAEILRLIRELAAEGLGVLMISSEIEEILDAADRVVVLSDGATSASFSRQDASEDAIMHAMAHSAAADAAATQANEA
jgi:ribose transport system ATP-binding protein